MNKDDYFKYSHRSSRWYAFRKALRYGGARLAILVILYLILNHYCPWANFQNGYFKWTTIVLILILSYLSYMSAAFFIEFHDFNEEIRKINLNDEASKKEKLTKLNRLMIHTNYFLDIQDHKLDIFKAFAPTPFLVFIFGILIKYTKSIINVDLSSIIKYPQNANVENIVFIAAIIMVIYYIWGYQLTWKKYRSTASQKSFLESAIANYEQNEND